MTGIEYELKSMKRSMPKLLAILPKEKNETGHFCGQGGAIGRR